MLKMEVFVLAQSLRILSIRAQKAQQGEGDVPVTGHLQYRSRGMSMWMLMPPYGSQGGAAQVRGGKVPSLGKHFCKHPQGALSVVFESSQANDDHQPSCLGR